jgi:hypothetical protein
MTKTFTSSDLGKRIGDVTTDANGKINGRCTQYKPLLMMSEKS